MEIEILTWTKLAGDASYSVQERIGVCFGTGFIWNSWFWVLIDLRPMISSDDHCRIPSWINNDDIWDVEISSSKISDFRKSKNGNRDFDMDETRRKRFVFGPGTHWGVFRNGFYMELMILGFDRSPAYDLERWSLPDPKLDQQWWHLRCRDFIIENQRFSKIQKWKSRFWHGRNSPETLRIRSRNALGCVSERVLYGTRDCGFW